MATQQQAWAPPAPPDEPLREGSRWRFHRPPSDAVAAWFSTQYLDEGMEHEHYVGGVVLISQSEKVKYTRPDGGTIERHETLYVPYIQIGTRVGYFHRLAEQRGLVPVIEPVEVARSKRPDSAYFNANMGKGLWWHVVGGAGGEAVRYLCSTWRVALYEPTSFAAKYRGEDPLPVREGRGTKQVGGGADMNAIAKAETGAVGRALGVAGVLVIGTGIATAEDMMELAGHAAPAAEEAPPQLPAVPSEIAPGDVPAPQSEAEEVDQLRSRCMALSTQLQEEQPETGWKKTAAWWPERLKEAGATNIHDAPVEALKSLVAYMERELSSGQA